MGFELLPIIIFLYIVLYISYDYIFLNFFGFAIITSITATCFTAANVTWQEGGNWPKSIDEAFNNKLLSLAFSFPYMLSLQFYERSLYL